MKAKTRKAKNCKVCGVEFFPFKTTDKWCSIDCAVTYGLEQAQKKKKQETRRMRKEFNDKDRSYQLKKAQEAFNAYIRERDKGLPCISCGTTNAKMTCGHWKSVGAHPALRFTPDNAAGQCWWNCNRNKSGNAIEFRIGLVKRIGVERVEELEKYHPPVNWTLDDIKEITRKFKAKTKELKNI